MFMVVYPNAKINLGLHIVSKRPDGYHNLETVFFPLDIKDKIEIEEADEFSFNLEGLKIDGDVESNLVVKAYRLLQKDFSLPNVKISMQKNIPFGAGLGGGSADASFTLRVLNEMFNLGLSDETLASYACKLGADCPFFIYNSPCYAEGIGDKLAPIPLDLSGLRLIMIKPECGVSTKEAYGGIKPKGNSELFNMVQDSNRLGVQELFRVAYNDFEDTVFEIHPEIATIKKRLQDAGAVYAAMSGSGSTVFGLFKNDAEGCTDPQLRLLDEEFTSMVIFNDTLR